MMTRRVAPRAVGLMVALILAVLAWFAAGTGFASPSRLPGAHAATGVTMVVKITGAKQGAFVGDAGNLRGANQILLQGYSFELVSPRDPATGLPTGKRQYKPMSITKQLDGASPQILTAAATNERLTSVVVTFSRTSVRGESVVFYIVTLTNAGISDVHQRSTGIEVLEDVSFTFQRVEQQDFDAHTTFIDDLNPST